MGVSRRSYAAQRGVTFADAVTQVGMPQANLTAKLMGLGGAAADSYNRLSINAPAMLFNNAGAGIEATVNKAAPANDAAFAFKTGFSARALIGLLGLRQEDRSEMTIPVASSHSAATISSMNHQTPIHEFVGVGLYSLADAAQLLKAPPRKLRRWMDGYDYKEDDGLHHVAPLWVPDIPKIDDHIELSFRDLIELRFVRAFLDKGIGLKAVRNCLEYARQCMHTDRPFSSGRFRTDGRSIFLESLEAAGEPKLLDLREKQYVFKQVVEQSFKDLDLEGDIVTSWRPYRGKDSIVVDPTRSFGQPVASASGVPTIVLAEAVKAEGSLSRVAAMYEVEKSVVQDAVRFHEELMAA